MLDHLWLVMSALLVFLMQAGFLCLESGRTRSKNSINVAAKNIIDFLLSASLFWLLGFGLMFGASSWGFVGTDQFFFGKDNSAFDISFFLFQMMFCGTAATLTSGAVAERMTFNGYILVTIILSVVIYPVAGHWAWSSIFDAANAGWLQQQGFIDFAGSTVVHSVGGWVALAAVLVIGPRTGRFSLSHRFPSGSNLPLAALGVLLIWFGWFGFNGGSVLAFNQQVPMILLNTCLSAIWGGLAVTFIYYWHHKYIDMGSILNGIIAGLVGITASCHAVLPVDALVIGVVSGAVMHYGSMWLEKLHIDDALSVVPAHLFAGVWGTIAVALFADPTVFINHFDRLQQLQIQLLGIVSIGVYSFTISYLLLRLIDFFLPLRVSLEHERQGLNITEHNANTELIDLLTEMETQQHQGDFTSLVKEEPFTEVGQIAGKYNQVITRVSREMAERDDAIDQFKTSEKRKSTILDSSMDSIISIDHKGMIIEFNPAAERTLGGLKKHVHGKSFIDLYVLKHDRLKMTMSLQHGFSSAGGLVLNRRTSIELQRISGDSFPAEITITSARLGGNQRTEYTLHIRDIARDIKLKTRLNFLAYKDSLTGLSNRTHMMKELHYAISLAKNQALSVALYFLDLDKFKRINDTLGHKAGDQLLCEVGRRLKSISRDTDVISRWGGDEFIFIITGCLDHEVIVSKAELILMQMRQPVEINHKFYNIPTSIGVAVSVNGIVDADSLIQFADIAMYRAKEKGRDTYQLYTIDMGEDAAKILNYEHEIKGALQNNEFYLLYQPKVNALTQTINGVEALIRWLHPEKGTLSPVEFIKVAEESDLIIDIGEYVIKQVLGQLRTWLDAGVAIVPVAVNISERQLTDIDFVDFLRSQLLAFDVEGYYLEIEITEGVLIKDIELCIDVLKDIKLLGIHISIDDFGTGYSSLNYLKRLPLDVLKIDRSFVNECNSIDEDREICAAIINLALAMKLTVVAEGVETNEQVSTLLELGCEVFQGYYFSRPVAIDAMNQLLNHGIDGVLGLSKNG